MDGLGRYPNSLRRMATRSAAALGLKRLRERARLSVRETADLIEIPHSTYASYENKYKKQYLPLDLVKKLAPHFRQNGVDDDQLYALAGVTDSLEFKNRQKLPQQPHPKEGEAMANFEELDAAAGAGAGAEVESAPVIRIWAIPANIASIASEAPANRIKILRVKGDSMLPTYTPIDRVMVDTDDRSPSPPGVFVVWDGLGFVIKRLQLISRNDPFLVKFTSDNPQYDPYERVLDEAYIQGRVIGKWLWT